MNERITEYSRGFINGMKASTDALAAAIDRDFTGNATAAKLLAILKTATQMAREQIEKSEKGPVH